MDIFTRFNHKNIQDRQIDTLIGLSKGLSADGNVSQAEAEFLQTWLIQNQHSQNPIILNLLGKVSDMLQDGVLDQEESAELLSLLHVISGDKTAVGEVAKTSTLPICSPPPKITFPGKTFLFTGTCAFGTRKQCEAAIATLGGSNAARVTHGLHYLILGTYVTDSWAHESFGRKIETAMKYRRDGLPVSIVTEEHWIAEAGL